MQRVNVMYSRVGKLLVDWIVQYTKYVVSTIDVVPLLILEELYNLSNAI